MGLEGVFHFGKCPPMIWYRNSLHWALKRLLFALTSVTSTKLYRKSDWSEFHQRLTWKCRCLWWKRRISYLHFDGPIFSKPIDFEIGEIVYRKYEKKDSSNTVCESDATDVFDYGLVLWPSGEITSLIKNSKKVSHHYLHCPIATLLISGIVVTFSANAQKLWIFLYYYLQQILSW
jgi:hypothetical protein